MVEHRDKEGVYALATLHEEEFAGNVVPQWIPVMSARWNGALDIGLCQLGQLLIR